MQVELFAVVNHLHKVNALKLPQLEDDVGGEGGVLLLREAKRGEDEGHAHVLAREEHESQVGLVVDPALHLVGYEAPHLARKEHDNAVVAVEVDEVAVASVPLHEVQLLGSDVQAKGPVSIDTEYPINKLRQLLVC